MIVCESGGAGVEEVGPRQPFQLSLARVVSGALSQCPRRAFSSRLASAITSTRRLPPSSAPGGPGNWKASKVVWRRDLIPDIVHIDMHVGGGKLYSAGASGVGVVLDEAAALTHPYLPSGLHILRRDDRSVSDW